MSRSIADRNLLFGVVALQMDFITRDALVTAMSAWVVNKQRSLGDILEEQQLLTPQRRQLLEALVSEHVAQHGNDPEQSLAALSPFDLTPGDLRVADPDVEASLAHVGRAHPAALDETISRAVGALTSAGQRFRILRPHRKGGLGEVFVAEDGELHRQVALKQIQDERADDPHSRARFLLEAEVTGGLEHPGIVPVYGLGQYDNGRPFYAMRFIRGDSLKEAIESYHDAAKPGSDGTQPRLDTAARNLQFRGLLRRFIDVCNAIEYAHSRGVLHRDLKPGNHVLYPFSRLALASRLASV